MDSSSFPSDLMSQMSLDGTTPTPAQNQNAENQSLAPEQASAKVSQLSDLIEEIDLAVTDAVVSDAPLTEEQKGLGVASNLFKSLKQKHSPTAAHGMRVALGCSVWAAARNDSEQFSKNLEVAALLHDIGKVGVPDELLAKPGELTKEERQLMSRQRLNGLEILSNCGYPGEILEAVAYSNAWFDGSVGGFKVSGTDIPFAARMLTIVDAFDSMTTQQVYRRAMSVERAIAELFTCAGTQFDPSLVASFCSSVAANWASLRQSAGERWVAQVETQNRDNQFWQKPALAPSRPGPDSATQCEGSEDDSELFHRVLIDNMTDGVLYVGLRQRILVWNRSLERKTGISSGSVREKKFVPSLIGMQYESGLGDIQDSDCPVQQVFESGQQIAKRVSVQGRGGESFKADMLIVPVLNTTGTVIGATITIHDVSSKVSLEKRVESLYTKVTQDPLTKVANRAEFDRVQAEFIAKHMTDSLPCSLIICDLDFFKKINDDYGHQAGDQALVTFAALLKRFQHVGDLVARYGGEEFVLLCTDCDNATATARAEEIRQILHSTPLPALQNKCMTSSFGVTEIQAGDTPETMLRRADRALLMAKEKGRNQVVQLGSGFSDAESKPNEEKGFFGWFKSPEGNRVSERTLITSVPIDLAIEKLKGFVSDQFAQIVSVDENLVQLRADGHAPAMMRRKSDRPVPFMISMNFSKMDEADDDGAGRKSPSRTKVQVIVEPIRSRDRRRGDLTERGDQIVRSLKAYLMATDEKDNERPMLDRAATESGRDE